MNGRKRERERERERERQIVHPTAQTRRVRTNTIHAVTTEHPNTPTKINQDGERVKKRESERGEKRTMIK